MAEWAIVSNTLCVESDGKRFYPSAKELYPLFTKERDELTLNGLALKSPILSFPSLKHSSFGSALNVSIASVGRQIYLEAFTQKKGAKIPIVIQDGKVVDHYIVNDKWFYITSDICDIEDAFSEAGVKSTGEITLAQYLKLKRFEMNSRRDLFEDHVDVSSLKQIPVNEIDVGSLSLRATLFNYQQIGFCWIESMLNGVQGCILGDEMGLGKTLQIITVALSMRQKGPCSILVVAPISLLANWDKECKKFAPGLNVHIHHGSQRVGDYKKFDPFDIVVTSYSVVVNDIDMLNMKKWDLVVLDEAQNIKNPDSSRCKACKELNREKSVAVTGTPFENHVTDIWSIVDFVMPGLLGPISLFNEIIEDDVNGARKIEPVLSSVMIRRLVKDVADELPPRIDVDQPLQMSPRECDEYIGYLDEVKSTVGADKISIGMIQKLRMYCTHPFTVGENDEIRDPYPYSVKYQRFCEILEEIIDKREKVIVFTSYKKMFDIFVRDIPSRYGVKIWTINGETEVSERQQIVDTFNQHPFPAVLVLNPRAAGTGLNITGANHVIHYNLEWNPALEDQSSARAYRKGQKKTVFVYRLYYKDTVEEIVQERVLRKRDIAEEAVVGADGDCSTERDLLIALAKTPKKEIME